MYPKTCRHHNCDYLKTWNDKCEWCFNWKLLNGYYSSTCDCNLHRRPICPRCTSSCFFDCSYNTQISHYCRHRHRHCGCHTMKFQFDRLPIINSCCKSRIPNYTLTKSRGFSPTTTWSKRDPIKYIKHDLSTLGYRNGSSNDRKLVTSSLIYDKYPNYSWMTEPIKSCVSSYSPSISVHYKDSQSDLESDMIPDLTQLTMMDDVHADDVTVTGRDEPCVATVDPEKNTEPRTVPSIGFKNPQGFCFLNSVIQLLYGCIDFTKEILNLSFKEENAARDNNVTLLKEIARLFTAIRDKNASLVNESLNNIQKCFIDLSEGDDVHKFYLQLLQKLHNGLKPTDGSLARIDQTLSEDVMKQDGENSHNKDKGFIFDLFYGQIRNKTKCCKCSKVLQEKYSLFKSLPLPVLKSDAPTSLSDCINEYIKISKIEDYDGQKCGCSDGIGEYGLEIELTRAPKYLLLYLNRGSYFENSEKKDDFITCDEILKLPTANGFMNYRLISVIDHVGNNEGRHYYCKCNYEGDNWWLINDTQINEINDVVTKNTIVFVFKEN